MDPLAVLGLFAQLAVSLTGFAGLLTAFRGGAEGWSAQEIAGIRNLLMMSVGALAFSTGPIPALAGGAAPADVFRWASLAMAAFLVLICIGGVDYVFRLKGRPRSWGFYWFFILGSVPVAALLTAGSFGRPGGAGLGPYGAGLVWLLSIGVVQFMFQIFSTLTRSDGR